MSHAQRGPLAAFAVLALACATAVGTFMANADEALSTAGSDEPIRIQARVADDAAPVLFGQRLLLGGGLPGQASSSTDVSADRSDAQQQQPRRRDDARTQRSGDAEKSTSSSPQGSSSNGRKGFTSNQPDISVDVRDDDGPRSEQETGGVPPGNSGKPSEPGKGKDTGNQNAKPDPVAPAPPPQQAPGNGPQGPSSQPPGHGNGHGHDRGNTERGNTERGPKHKARSSKAHGKAPRGSEKRNDSRGDRGKGNSAGAKKKHRGKH